MTFFSGNMWKHLLILLYNAILSRFIRIIIKSSRFPHDLPKLRVFITTFSCHRCVVFGSSLFELNKRESHNVCALWEMAGSSCIEEDSYFCIQRSRLNLNCFCGLSAQRLVIVLWFVDIKSIDTNNKVSSIIISRIFKLSCVASFMTYFNLYSIVWIKKAHFTQSIFIPGRTG